MSKAQVILGAVSARLQSGPDSLLWVELESERVEGAGVYTGAALI